MKLFKKVFCLKDTANFYDKSLPGRTSCDTLAFRSYADRFANLLGLPGSRKVWADVGCGPGHLGITLAQKMKGGKVYFIDVSPEMINLTQKNIREGDWNSSVEPETIVADGQDIGQVLGRVKLDGIVCRHVIQLMEEPHRFFSGAYNLLRPGGKLIFSLIGHNTFNFVENNSGNSLLQNKFFSRLLWSTFQELPYLLAKLSPSDIDDLIYRNIFEKSKNGITFSKKALLPRLDKMSVFSETRKAGIPESAIVYLIMGEIHTVGFKEAFSQQLGSIPIPGIWSLFDRLDFLTRTLAVRRIYDRAFPGDKNSPIFTEDPLFVVTKEESGLASIIGSERAQFISDIVPTTTGIRIATESFEKSAEQIAELSLRYGYDAWRVRGFDIQRASAHLTNPPPQLQPLKHATLVLQANGFTFTCSEKGSLTDPEAEIVTPYNIVLEGNEKNPLPARIAKLFYESRLIDDFGAFKLIEVMLAPSLWYFAFKTPTGQPIPTYLIVNPYEDCSLRCKPCSRLPFFRDPNRGYEENTRKIIAEVLAGIHDKNDVRFINIITGSQKDGEAELTMFQEIINNFRKAGFSNAGFGVYSSAIREKNQMQCLRKMGVVTFAATMETTSDEMRSKLYGRKGKGLLSFSDYLEMIKNAEVFFPYVSASLILGHEASTSIKKNLMRFAGETLSPLIHFIPRIFLPHQFKILHPEAKEKGLAYYLDLLHFIEDINKDRATFSAFFEKSFGVLKQKVRFRS